MGKRQIDEQDVYKKMIENYGESMKDESKIISKRISQQLKTKKVKVYPNILP